MRHFVLFALVSLLPSWAVAQQQPQQGQAPEPPKKARIEGSVVNLAGEPVPRAQLRLSGPPSVQNGQLAPPANVAATAGDDGKFTIENIDPGRNYILSAQRPGFVTARYGARSTDSPGTPLVLEPDQSLKGIIVKMTPQGIISGRVTDQTGDAVQNSVVAVMRRGYQRGVRQLLLVNTSQTNDQGEFRAANLAPGRYYLVVTASRIAPASSTKTANLTTYFPNGLDAQSAAPIEVTAGADLRGMDVRLLTGPVFSVRGKAVDANGAPVGGLLGSATPREELSSANILSNIGRGTFQTRPPDGSFEITNLSPGTHVLQVLSNISLNGVATPRMFGRMDVTVRDADVTGVTFALTSGTTVTGSVRLEDGDITKLVPPASTASVATLAAGLALSGIPGIQGAGMAVALFDATALASNNPGKIGSGGTLTFEGVAPSKYQLNVGGLPQGHYVKSASFGGTDVTKAGLDLTSGAPGKLDIVLSSKAADVTGTVRPEKDESVAGVLVTLWPRDPEPASINNGIKIATTDQNGGFTFQNLRPGVYYTAAWEAIDNGLAQVPDFLTLVTSDAVKLELAEGAHSSADVKLIPTAKIKAAEEKLP